MTNENLEGIIALRERIDKIEKRALAKPGDKRISEMVFALKRERDDPQYEGGGSSSC